MAARQCDSCRSAAATLFCRADSAFLCSLCDSRVHAAGNLASRHARVWLCEVCEQSPAELTCKADAAALCAACDRHVHSANPLARRHDRVPVAPFFDAAPAAKSSDHAAAGILSDHDVSAAAAADEAEAATWILPDPKLADCPDLNSVRCGLEMDQYMNLGYGSGDPAPELRDSGTADRVVPARGQNGAAIALSNEVGPSDNYFEFDLGGSKPFSYCFGAQSLTRTVSSPSAEVGVVPDASVPVETADAPGGRVNESSESTNRTAQISGSDREARVLRYREKRKNRRFEKTIRYASRKAYAETRPRIKGRFAKRETGTDRGYGSPPGAPFSDTGYGVVPSF